MSGRERDEIGRWRELTAAELKQACEVYERLHSVRSGAEELGLSYYGFYYRLFRAGAILDDPNGLTEDDHQLLWLLYCDHGMSTREVRDALGLRSIGAVLYRLEQAGITPRPPTDPYSDDVLLETEEVYLEAKSCRAAARSLGLSSPSTITRRLKELARRRKAGLIAAS